MKPNYKNWKKITKLEKQAINSLKQAKKIILKNIPKNKIISIYVGGSFIRKEMNKESDVDTWTIVKDSKLLKKLEKLNKKYGKTQKPNISISGYSLWELKRGKRVKSKKLRANPVRFIKKIKDYQLIYGKSLNSKDFATRDDKEDFKKLLWAFNNIFLKNKVVSFQGLIKQVFWLTEAELKIKGKNPPHSWKEVGKLVNKNHIFHKAMKLRKNKPKNKKIKKEFINKLKIHLKNLTILKK